MSQAYSPSTYHADDTWSYEGLTPLSRQALLKHNTSTRNHLPPGTAVVNTSNFTASPEPYCYGRGCSNIRVYHEGLQDLNRWIDPSAGAAEATHAQHHHQPYPPPPECVTAAWPIRHTTLQEPLYCNNDLAGIGAQFYV